MKRSLFVFAASALLLGLGMTQGQQSEAQGRPTFELPPQARPVSPGVFFLGTAIDHGIEVAGYAFVHERGRSNAAKPPWAGGGGKTDSGGAEDCYSHLAKGARWNSAENYLFNPANAGGMGVGIADLNAAVNAWDNEVAANIFGAGAETGATLSADTTSTDGLNEVYFGNISDQNVIAVTITWGVFGGPPHNRRLVEWDMIFDDDGDWTWSNVGAPDAMDFLNIAAHEAGHAAGMGHTDSSSTCVEQTMYPSASNGETQKRDLGVGDIAGVVDLYN